MKLNYGKTFFLGLGFLGVSAIWAIYGAFVPVFLSEKFRLDPLWISFFITLDNIAALLIQPPVGVWSDKIRTPIGRRMPFILFGAPVAALAFAFVPLVSALPLFVLCTSTLLICMAVWRTPVVALVADVTPSPLRSQASAAVSFMGGVGAIIAYFGGGALAKSDAAYPFWLGSGVVIVAAALLFAFVREPKTYASGALEVDDKPPGFVASLREIFADSDKSALCLLLALFCLMVGYTAVEGFFSLYALEHLGLRVADSSRLFGLASLSFLVFALPSGSLGARWGRRATVMLGLIGMAALLLVLFFLPAATLIQPLFSLPVLGAIPLVGAILMLIGLCYALVIIHPIAMLSDMTDSSRLGTYTGLYYLFQSLAAIAGPILNAGVIELSGQNYNTVMLFAPVMLALAWALMWGVKRGESVALAPPAINSM